MRGWSKFVLVLILLVGFLVVSPHSNTYSYFQDVERVETRLTAGTWDTESDSLEEKMVKISDRKFSVFLKNVGNEEIIIQGIRINKHISDDKIIEKIKLVPQLGFKENQEEWEISGEDSVVIEDLDILIQPNKQTKLECWFETSIKDNNSEKKKNNNVRITGPIAFEKNQNETSNNEETLNNEVSTDFEVIFNLNDGLTKTVNISLNSKKVKGVSDE